MIGERNLTPERGPSVWQQTRSTSDQWVRGVGGGALMAAGAALVVWGAQLAWRGLRDRSAAANRSPVTSTGTPTPSQVDEESAQSFPASDSPSWTPTTGAR